jgi:RNA recognition motif-containing protein
MAQKLFVGGIAFATTSEGLRDFFAQSGTVVSANVVTDQFSGRSRGFGFVEMATAEEATKAASQLNGRELDGRQLRVEVAKPKSAGSGGGFGGGRGGYGGGSGRGKPGGWR